MTQQKYMYKNNLQNIHLAILHPQEQRTYFLAIFLGSFSGFWTETGESVSPLRDRAESCSVIGEVAALGGLSVPFSKSPPSITAAVAVAEAPVVSYRRQKKRVIDFQLTGRSECFFLGGAYLEKWVFRCTFWKKKKWWHRSMMYQTHVTCHFQLNSSPFLFCFLSFFIII